MLVPVLLQPCLYYFYSSSIDIPYFYSRPTMLVWSRHSHRRNASELLFVVVVVFVVVVRQSRHPPTNMTAILALFMNKFIHNITEEYKVRVVFLQIFRMRIGFFGSRTTDTKYTVKRRSTILSVLLSRLAVVAAALHTQRIHQTNR